jgi:ribosomal-protein-alanine N-acetyltransferase
VASFLLGYCLRLAKRHRFKKVLLEVRASNRAAIALYRKVGFSETGRRQGHYLATGEDALVMTKEMAGTDTS